MMRSNVSTEAPTFLLTKSLTSRFGCATIPYVWEHCKLRKGPCKYFLTIPRVCPRNTRRADSRVNCRLAAYSVALLIA